MRNFTIECWYRYGGGDEKDFYQVEVTAPNEILALQTAHELSTRFIYKSQIIKTNGND